MEPDFDAVIQLFEDNGQRREAADISTLLFYMDNMEQQYYAVLRELQEVRSQLEDAAPKPSPARAALKNSLAALDGYLDTARKALSNLRDTVGSWARSTAEDVRLHGASVLDRAMEALRVRPMLEALQEGLQGCVNGTRNAIERGEAAGAELRSAGGHLRAALYTMVGKRPPARLKSAEGKFQAVVLAPLRGMQKALSAMNNNALGIIGAVERMEQRAEDGRERLAEKREQKVSIRQELAAGIREAKEQEQLTGERARKPREAAL